MVVGGAGKWGSQVAAALAERGLGVLTVDHLGTGDQNRVRFGPLLKADVRETSRLERAIREYGIEHLFHCALAEGESPLRTYDEHLGGVLSLLAAAKTQGVRSLTIFSGSTRTEPMIARILEDCARVNGVKCQLVPLGESDLAHAFRFIS